MSEEKQRHPCIHCTGHFPDCREHCVDLELYHLEQEKAEREEKRSQDVAPR
jgi:hypothetical protein